jgi:hypothetical protein
MAHITLQGSLEDPNGSLSVGDQIRFTHDSTTGLTLKGAVSVETITPLGNYYIELQYGFVLVEYKPSTAQQFKNLGVATVNATNTATSIPELLNALTPVSDAKLIEFQAILADCVTAKNAAAASAVDAATSAAQLTTTELISSTAIYAADVVVNTVGFTTSGAGGAPWKQNGVTGQTVSQTPAQLGDALLNDGNGNQWSLIGLAPFDSPFIFSSTLGDVAGNESNVTQVFYAALVRLKSLSGGVLQTSLGLKTITSRLPVSDNITIVGGGIDATTLILSSAFPVGLSMFINETISVGAYTYGNSNINIKEMTISGNGNTGRTTGLVDLIKTKDSSLKHVKFVNSDYFGITDAGNLNLLIKSCKLDNLGKTTGVSPAIWSQSYIPDGSKSKGTKILSSDFTNNNRSAIQAASQGMLIHGNTFDNNGESTIFMNTNASGCIISENTITRANLTDISAHGIEVGGTGHLICDNTISDVDGTGISTLDVTNTRITNNTINGYRVDDTFYSVTWSASGIGVTNTSAGVVSNLVISDNTIIGGANGVNAIVVYHQALSTPCVSVSILDNDLVDGGSGDDIHYQSAVTKKMGANCKVKGNTGHISNSAAIVSFQAGTGVGDYEHSNLGFPPQKLRFKTLAFRTNEHSVSDGVAAKLGNGFVQHYAINSSTGATSGGTQGSFTVIRIDDSAGTTLFKATISDFDGVDGLGFKISKSVATINPVILLEAEP